MKAQMLLVVVGVNAVHGDVGFLLAVGEGSIVGGVGRWAPSSTSMEVQAGLLLHRAEGVAMNAALAAKGSHPRESAAAATSLSTPIWRYTRGCQQREGGELVSPDLRESGQG